LETKLLTNDLGRIIFVVTGIDRLNNPEDASKSVKHVKDRIRTRVLQRAKDQYGEDSPEYAVYRRKIGAPKVFGVSAYQALQAKLTGDRELLAKSHFPEFEAALEQFLTHERGSVFLQLPINRLIASATEVLSTLSSHQNALAMRKEEFQAAYEQSVAEIKTLRARAENAALNQDDRQEVGALLNNTQNTIADIYTKRGRDEVLIEREQRDLNQISIETQRILGNAQWLSKQLIQDVNVDSADSSASGTQSPPERLDDDLSSECNVNYTRLRDLLKAQQWQEANQETKRVMLQVAGCEKEGWLDSNAIDCFPVTDIRTIDQLWVKYSNSRFGFSIQKKIFRQVKQQEQEFMQKVNWTQASLKGGIFLEENHLNFTLEAPEGHLPMVFGGEHGWIFSVL
jgi:hypothetical protein